jgi:hypothetical protein
MPQIETWSRLPVAIRDHLIERMHDRNIGIADLSRLRPYYRRSPSAFLRFHPASSQLREITLPPHFPLQLTDRSLRISLRQQPQSRFYRSPLGTRSAPPHGFRH